MWSRPRWQASRFWLGLTLLGFSSLTAQIAPRRGSTLEAKAFRHPSLSIGQRLVPVEELSPALREESIRKLDALGISATGARIDRRSGRWATLMPSQPLLPGSGMKNDLQWDEFAVARSGGLPTLEETARQALEKYLRRHQRDLDIDIDQLEPARVTTHEGGTRIQVYAPRRVAGVPVRDSYLTAIINHGNLILLGVSNWGEVRVATQPSITAAAARGTLADHLKPIAVESFRQEAELALLPTAQGADPSAALFGEGYGYRLAWVLQPELPGRLGRWEALVDAHSGELLAFTDTLTYATTRKILGGVYPVSNDGQAPDGVEQAGYPMPFADLTTPNGTLFTDTGGNYPVCVDGTVATTLNGRFIRIEDICGSFSESSSGDIDLGTSAGIDCDVPAGSDSLGNTHSARTAFFELNRMAEQARGHLPNNAWLKRQLTAVVNIPDFGYPEFNCNAFWDETTVNFFTSGALPQGGPECTNTGEVTGVLDHEWGHGLDDNDNIPTISSPGEGVADVYAALRLNDSCIARGFYTGLSYCGDNDPCTSCDGVREIDWAARTSGAPHDLAWIDDENNCPAPFLGDMGPCGGTVHCEGAVYAEAVWDLVRRDLMASPFNMDLNTALEVGTRLTYLGAGNVGAWYTCANDGQGTGDGCNADSGYLNFLAADDDNGDLTDGTPHMGAIFAAFDRHGIACASPTNQNSGCSGAPSTAPVVTATPFDRAVHLSWGSVAGATAYQIFRTEGVFGCSFGKIKVGETTGTEFLDEGLLNGTESYYVVIPVGADSTCMGPASSCTAATPASGAGLGFDPSSVALVAQNGDLDPFVDNCEETQVTFAVANIGSGTLTDVELVNVEVLSHPGSVVITSTVPQTLSPSLAGCAEATGQFSFFAEGLTFNDTLELRIDVTAAELGGRIKSHLVRLVGAETSLESYDSKTFSFESGSEDWQVVTGTFGRTDVGGGANASSFYMASSASLSDQCDAIRSPIMRLSPTSTLEVSTQFDIEPALDIEGTIFWFDRANLGLHEVLTGERTPISPDGGRLYNATGLYGSCGTQNQDGWADAMTSWDSSTWSRFALRTDDFADDFVQLDMRYGTDVELEGAGFWFDEVTVTNVDLLVADGQADTCIPGNQPPDAQTDSFTVETVPAVLDVLANDDDPDVGDSLRIVGVTQPAAGKVVINELGPDLDTLTYYPDAGQGRVEDFQYSVSDGRGGSSVADVTVDLDVILYDGFESGDTGQWIDSGGPSCDPDGTYSLITPSAVQYQCCTILGPPLVDVNVTEFVFANDGAEITPVSMHYAATLSGSGASCPSGDFSNFDTFAGGCTEIYSLDGTFIDDDTWAGTFNMTFTGADCSCFGATPCVDQSFPVTAVRP